MMVDINITPVVEKIKNVIENHKLAPGSYKRYPRDTMPNPYGCADAANLLYTLGCFPKDCEERSKFVASLQSFQDAQTGLFFEPSHHTVHTTAHCIGALELFEAKPVHPLYALEKYFDIQIFFDEMAQADFLHRGCMAHFGAGLFAALVNTESVGRNWINRYFGWFDEQCDEKSGMWVRQPVEDSFPIHIQMGDAFHYMFNYEYMHHAYPYPEQLIDSCLSMYNEGKMPASFGKQFHFIETDWVYCLNRASRQTVHRFDEIKATLTSFAEGYIAYLNSVDFETSKGANDLHLLFGTTCCLAELQLALPDKLYSDKPLRFVLDRRPFI